METPTVLDDHSKSKKEENKDRKKGHKSHKDVKQSKKLSPIQSKAPTSTQAHPLSSPARSHSGPELDQQPGVKAKVIPEKTSVTQDSSTAPKTVPGPSGTGEVASGHSSCMGHVDQAYDGACAYPPE